MRRVLLDNPLVASQLISTKLQFLLPSSLNHGGPSTATAAAAILNGEYDNQVVDGTMTVLTRLDRSK